MWVISNFDMMDFRVNDYDIWVTIVLFHFSVAIAKCSGDWKATRDDSDGALSDWATWTSKHYVVILVDISSSFDYASLFCFLRWFVVIRYRNELLPLIRWHHCSWITCVGYPDIVVDYQHHDGARTWFISYLHLVLSHESFLRLFESIEQCLLRIWRETLLISYNIVKIISQELSTSMASVAIKYRKKGGLLNAGSKRFIWFGSRLLEVENNRYSILIIVSWCAIMSIGSIW